MIIDTDLSRWWDDATAIGLANVLQQQGAANVLGIVSDVPNPVAVAALDAIDTAYGHAEATSPRRHDVYVHLVDQKALNQSIERLLTLNTNGAR